MRPVPDNLLRGVSALGASECVELKGAPEWYERDGRWALQLCLVADVAQNGLVPSETHWWVTMAHHYPLGVIKVYPDKRRGITQTFHHQMHNGKGSPDLPWRAGDICVVDPSSSLPRFGDSASEPWTAEGRLRWHVERALEWLRLASRGELVHEGDPFELPDFGTRTGVASSPSTSVAYSESAADFEAWSAVRERCGLVDLRRLAAPDDRLVVAAFTDLKGRPIAARNWGTATEGEMELGVWVLLDSMPVLEPYSAPMVWRDLLRAAPPVSPKRLAAVVDKLRGRAPILLVGFPVPETVGSAPARVVWQALRLPGIPVRAPNGFSNTRRGRGAAYRATLEQQHQDVAWLPTEDWSPERLTSRGGAGEALRSRKVLLLGAGALGAPVAELLARSGVSDLTVLDGDVLAAGNLVRHTLLFTEIGKNKAEALATRLNATGPHIRARGLPYEFPPPVEAHEQMRQYDLVIDCTADRDVPHSLANFDWGGERRFVSLALSYGAERLLCYHAKATGFPVDDAERALGPWETLGLAEHPPETYPREGVGCWHPVFPARCDDVCLMAATAVKCIESIVEGKRGDRGLVVYEAPRSDAGLTGPSERSTSGDDWWVELQPDPTDYTVLVSPEARTSMLIHAASREPHETGGILTGRMDQARRVVTVTGATSAPADSRHSEAGFERGIDGLQRYLDALWRATGERYVGEWHSHPANSSSPSPQDVGQMRLIAAGTNYQCSAPVLVVVGLRMSANPQLSVQTVTNCRALSHDGSSLTAIVSTGDGLGSSGPHQSVGVASWPT